MNPGHVQTKNTKIRSQGLLMASFLFLAIWTGNPELAAQRLIINGMLKQEAGSFMQIRGDLVLHQRPQVQGTVALRGSLADYAGLQVQEGHWIFNGTGEEQLIQGTEISHLWDVDIAADARVVLPAHARLTVAGSLVNHNEEAGLLLESAETGRASLLHYATGVMASVQYWLPEEYMVGRYISSPIAEQDIEPEFHQGFDAFGTWHEMMQTFVMFTQQEIFPTFRDANDDVLYFLPAKGYYGQYQPLWDQIFIREFRGALQQGLQEFRLMMLSHPSDPYTGFNLMGNPYPSSIDWLAEEGWSGREYLVGGDKDDPVMWLWNDSIQNYGVSHPRSRTRSHNGNKGLIQPMAAFWVQAAQGSHGKKIGMDDRVRLHGDGDERARQKEKVRGQTIRIILASDQGPQRDEVIVELGHPRPGAASKKFPSQGLAPQLYMLCDSIADSPRDMITAESHSHLDAQPREAGNHSKLLPDAMKGELHIPPETLTQDTRYCSILILDAMKADFHIPLEAITREAGKYSIRLEYEKAFDADVSLTLRGPEGALKGSASWLEETEGVPEGSGKAFEGAASWLEDPESIQEGVPEGPESAPEDPEGNKSMEAGRSYHLYAAEEHMLWQLDLIIRP